LNAFQGKAVHKTRGIFGVHGVVNSELAVGIAAHCVHVVVLSDEASVVKATGDLLNCDIVRAKPGNRISVIGKQVNTKAQLSISITTPREHLRVELILRLDVYNIFSRS
jgi:hypothetical protein